MLGWIFSLQTVVHSKTCRDAEQMGIVQYRAHGATGDGLSSSCGVLMCEMHPGADSSLCYFGGSPLLSGQQHQHKRRNHAAVILGAGEWCFH